MTHEDELFPSRLWHIFNLLKQTQFIRFYLFDQKIFFNLASTKKEQFLKAVEKSESSPTPAPTQKTNERESRESAYAPIDSSESELYEYDASDPLDESPKIGLLYFTERDIRMEKKLIKKVAAEIEENGVGGVKPMLTKKLNSLEKEPIRIGIIGDSMSGKSTLIKVNFNANKKN